MNTTESLVRAILSAYVEKDRAAAERLIASDFHFTSPNDNRIDREGYFRRCWPGSERFKRHDVRRIFVEGDDAFVTYEVELDTGKQFRNTEFLRTKDGQITEVEVYFGWDIPHPPSIA